MRIQALAKLPIRPPTTLRGAIATQRSNAPGEGRGGGSCWPGGLLELHPARLYGATSAEGVAVNGVQSLRVALHGPAGVEVGRQVAARRQVVGLRLFSCFRGNSE